MIHKPHGNERWFWRSLFAAGLVLLALVAIASRQQPVQAKSDYLTAFRSTYPNVVGTSLDSCGTCHTNAIPALNPYGLAYAGSGRNFRSIESADSDGDGASNLVEILALTLPGDPASKPAASPTPTQVSTAPTATPTQVSTAPTATPTQAGASVTPIVTRTPDGDDDDPDKTPEATRTPDGDDDDDDDDDLNETPEVTRTPDGDDDDDDYDQTPQATRTPDGDDDDDHDQTPQATRTPDGDDDDDHDGTPQATRTPDGDDDDRESTPEATETPELHQTPSASVALQGFIEDLGKHDLTVAGQRVQVDIQTEIQQDHGALAVGAEIAVQAEARSPGTLYARRIDILNSPVVTVRTYLPLFVRRR